MRTPWRMLADLVSGNPSKDDAEAIPETNAQHAPPPPPPAKSGDADAAAETVVVEAPAIDEEKSAVAAPHAEPNKADEPVGNRSAANAPAKAKRPSVIRRQKEAAAPSAPATTEQSFAKLAAEPAAKPVQKSELDEMADLDRDIDDLRQRLSDKLVRQNAQLRKLISRYDG